MRYLAFPDSGIFTIDKEVSMGFFSFFKSKGSAAEAEEKAAREALERATRNLDIDISIAAHDNWKVRLSSFIDGDSSETFTATNVACDKSCELGKWLYSDGEQNLGKYAAFIDLKGQHKMFHLSASSVISLTQAGKTEEAKKLLNGEFNKLSIRVTQRLEDLKGM